MAGPYSFDADISTGDTSPTPAAWASGVAAALNEAASAATPSVMVLRDAAGRAKFADPSADADAATKGYVDLAVGGIDVSGYAPLASPVFTGDPKAPTPATGDDDTSVATTAFVKAQGYAPLSSPALTGNPTAPTQTAGNDSTRLATTAFVQAAVAGARGLYAGINAQTGTTYTLVLADQGKLVTCSNAGAITVTVPPNSSVAFPVGAQVDVAVLGAGMVTFVEGSGVTISGTPSLVTRAQSSAVTLIKLATDTWLVVGDLADA